MYSTVCSLSARACRRFVPTRLPTASQLSRAYLSSVRFTETHEFVRVNGNVATIGITQHAAEALGEVVYVGLPTVGDAITAGEIMGTVESVKAASDLVAPVSGTVQDVNMAIEETPGRINESPMDEGWFVKVQLSAEGEGEVNSLLDEQSYNKLLEEQ